MPRIRVRTVVGAPRSAVWSALADIPSHVEWMADAESIRFVTARRHGVGTTFDCDTRVGPLRVTDRMEIVEWKRGRAIGVVHTGIVTGAGRFTIRRTRGRRGRNHTVVTWTERLRFPWWLGGPVGGIVGGRVLAAIWRGNLRRLRARIEHAG